MACQNNRKKLVPPSAPPLLLRAGLPATPGCARRPGGPCAAVLRSWRIHHVPLPLPFHSLFARSLWRRPPGLCRCAWALRRVWRLPTPAQFPLFARNRRRRPPGLCRGSMIPRRVRRRTRRRTRYPICSRRRPLGLCLGMVGAVPAACWRSPVARRCACALGIRGVAFVLCAMLHLPVAANAGHPKRYEL